jgi:hypothetical protein
MFKEREMSVVKKIKAALQGISDKTSVAPTVQHTPSVPAAFFIAKPRVFVNGIALDDRLAAGGESRSAAKAH